MDRGETVIGMCCRREESIFKNNNERLGKHKIVSPLTATHHNSGNLSQRN